MSIKKYSIGMVRNGTEVVDPEKRKTILFLSDLHLRPTGLGSQKKEIMYETCHQYNYIDVGYIQGLQPGQNYSVQDRSERVQNETGVVGASIKILPYDIYNQDVQTKQRDLLVMIDTFKPDAIFHFTDPHSWYWMYQIQHLIRNRIPIIYYNIWDNLPYPKYNERFYSCSDLIMNISKQTQNIVNNVCINYLRQPWQTKYVPHGINMNVFRPLGKNNVQFKKVYEAIQRDSYDFIFLFVNKNIIRKQATLVMEAFKWFVNNYLTPQQKKRCSLIMKTQVIYGPGMPLNVYKDEIINDPTVDIRFIPTSLAQQELVALYNCSDVIISFSSAEGFGLSSAEGLACEKPFIAPVIGGLQDQMNFLNESGDPYENDVITPSNCYKTFTKHAPWVYPIWFSGLGATGSLVTPYIYEMYHSLEDLIQAMRQAYQTPIQDRQSAGQLGRNWMNKIANMSSQKMAELMVIYINQMFDNWKPKSQYKMFVASPINKTGKSGSFDPIKRVWY